MPPTIRLPYVDKYYYICRFHFVLFCHHHHHHHHHHVPEGLGVFPVPWSSRRSWSLHLFLYRPMFLRPFGLYCSACFGSLFVSILCTCCSHSFWYCFISFTMFSVPVFALYIDYFLFYTLNPIILLSNMWAFWWRILSWYWMRCTLRLKQVLVMPDRYLNVLTHHHQQEKFVYKNNL